MLFFFVKFIYFERRIDRMPSRRHTVSEEPNADLEFTSCEIVTWAKIESDAESKHPQTNSWSVMKSWFPMMYTEKTVLLVNSKLLFAPDLSTVMWLIMKQHELGHREVFITVLPLNLGGHLRHLGYPLPLVRDLTVGKSLRYLRNELRDCFHYVQSPESRINLCPF